MIKKLVNDLQVTDILKRKEDDVFYTVNSFIRGERGPEGNEVATNVKENFYFSKLGYVAKDLMTKFFEGSSAQVNVYDKEEVIGQCMFQ